MQRTQFSGIMEQPPQLIESCTYSAHGPWMVPTAQNDGKTSHQRVNGMRGRGLRPVRPSGGKRQTSVACVTH